MRWCVVDERLRDVTEFAETPARLRPPAVCPYCRQPVVMKLGSKRAYHCAHRPSDDCALRRGETALHFNAKMHLHSQLLNGKTLKITEKCAGILGRGDCGRTHSRVWLEGWDAVEVEYSIRGGRTSFC